MIDESKNQETNTTSNQSNDVSSSHDIPSLYQKFQTQNTFLDCPIRFKGEYGDQEIERFTKYIECYKSVKNINDEQTLLELPFLLDKHALIWWELRKHKMKTWNDAKENLLMEFGKLPPPASTVYRWIFEKPYDKTEPLGVFIKEKLLLFAQLPHPQPSESMQLDIICSLMSLKYSSKVKRFNNIKQFFMKFKDFNANTQDRGQQQTTHFESNKRTIACQTDETFFSSEKQQPNVIEETAESDNENEPRIKVRRTEDLMPQNENGNVTTIDLITNDDQSDVDESKDTRNSNKNSSNLSNIDVDFHIDREIMEQIDNIFIGSDVSIQPLPPLLQRTASNSTTANAPDGGEQVVTVNFNNLSSCEALASYLPQANPKVNIKNEMNCKKIPPNTRIKLKKHNPDGHLSDDCPKRKRSHKRSTEKLNQTVNSSISTVTAQRSNGHGTSSIKSSQSTSVNPNPTISNKKNTSANLSLPGPIKTLASKLKNSIIPQSTNHSSSNISLGASNSSSSPKCHQCGTVGYYRSICPNCSPIYFYKPSSNVHR